MSWFRFLRPSCPNKDGGKLHIDHYEQMGMVTIWQCDVCKELWI